MKIKNVKKILVFKLCCIGDIIFLTPTIKALKNNFPGAQITYIHSSWVESLISYLPNIDKSIEFNPPVNKNIIFKLLSAVKLIIKLRKENFDLVFLGHRTNYFGLLLYLSGIKFRFGFGETKFMNCTAKYDGSLHETKRYLNVLQRNGIKVNDESVSLITPKDKNEIKEQNGIEREKFIIGIYPFGGVNPGTDMNIKRWEIDKYYKLIESISNDYPENKIIIFEGKMDGEKLNKFNPKKNTLIKDIDIDLISICDVFICGDTGPLHIASAFNISTLSVFGPSDPRLVAPINNNSENVIHKYIWKKPNCSPCYTPSTATDINNPKYWNENNFICYTHTHECIKKIEVKDVYSELKDIILRLNIAKK
jgi:ADP-heptose:LPS heptosyltransferase